MPETTYDWAIIAEDKLRLVLDQGAKCLEAQINSALAADTRALTVATILVGFATAIYGGSIGYWSETKDYAILAAGLSSGTAMLLGSAFCFYSARPIDFDVAGNEPKEYWPWLHQPISELLGNETINYQEKIIDNNKLLSENATWFRAGLFSVLAAPLLGLIFFALLT